MSLHSRGTARQSRWRRAVAGVVGVVALGSAIGLAAAAPAAAASATIDDATLTWGVSGYAQTGAIAPWTFSSYTGNVSGTLPSSYVVDPVPATSMPAGKTLSGATFTAGTGVVDPTTGAGQLSWTGSFDTNGYPAYIGAPSETWANPQLTVAADGSGSLSFEYTIGAGKDMSGNPTPAQNVGRVTVLTFDAGSISGLSDAGFRLTPDYQGVVVAPDTLTDASAVQMQTCSTDSGATGWWGAWNPDFVNVVPAMLRPHFYSTGCGGKQDNKPALPVDISYTVDAPATPAVVVSETTLNADGTSDITVTGSGFPQASSTGSAGVYVTVGPKIGDTWWTQSSSAQFAKYVRPNFTGDETASGAKLNADGTFTVHFTDVKPVYTKGTTTPVTYDAATTPLYVLTFATQGSSDRALDTQTPLTFVTTDGSELPVVVEVPTAPVGPGAFSWTIDGGSAAVNLGTATSSASGFQATGALRTITVTDTRTSAPAWSIAGQVSAFTAAADGATFPGSALGWAPALSENTVGAIAGATVAPGAAASDGLASSSTLVSAPVGHVLGSVKVDAGLSLLAPKTTTAGSYTATLTLTALS